MSCIYLFSSLWRHKFWDYHSFFINSFSYITKRSEQSCKYLKRFLAFLKYFLSFFKGFQVTEIVSHPKLAFKYFEIKLPFVIVTYQVYCNSVKWWASCYWNQVSLWLLAHLVSHSVCDTRVIGLESSGIAFVS